MTEQDRREKVIKGLECIRDYDPMFRVAHDDVFSKYAADAIALLKAQTRTIEQYEREREQQMWNMPPMGGFHDD